MQEKSLDQKREKNRMNAPELHMLYQRLEQEFEKTFVGELIPGILHNFANPLNGIMGRAQILQRRLRDTIAKIGDQFPDAAAAFLEPHGKLVSDIAAICQESDRFYYMFQDVSSKFYTLGSATPERINLSQLLASELRFADYYLDFKHEARKELALEESSPEIYGIASHYSLCFWSLFRSAMERMKAAEEKTLYLSTAHDDSRVMVRLRYQGQPWTAEEKKAIDLVLSGADGDGALAGFGPSLVCFCLSLCLLQRLGAQIDFQEQEGCYDVMIRVSYGHSTEKS